MPFPACNDNVDSLLVEVLCTLTTISPFLWDKFLLKVTENTGKAGCWFLFFFIFLYLTWEKSCWKCFKLFFSFSRETLPRGQHKYKQYNSKPNPLTKECYFPDPLKLIQKVWFMSSVSLDTHCYIWLYSHKESE